MLASLDEPPSRSAGWSTSRSTTASAPLSICAAGRERRRRPPSPSTRATATTRRAQFPAIVEGARRDRAQRSTGPLLLDGEIVAVDATRPAARVPAHPGTHSPARRRADIARAEQRAAGGARPVRPAPRRRRGPARPLPLAARRLRLAGARPHPRRGAKRRAAAQRDRARRRPAAAATRAKREGWEGLIVKDGQSVYHSGRRTPAWRKMKLLKQQEFVVGGWTEPRQTRQHFGALLVGYYDDAATLRWAGSVGTGFDQDELDRVAKLLRAREIDDEPVRRHVQDAASGALGEARCSSPRSGSRSGRATACCGSLSIWARETDKKAKDVVREDDEDQAQGQGSAQAQRQKPTVRAQARGVGPGPMNGTGATGTDKPAQVEGPGTIVADLASSIDSLDDAREDAGRTATSRCPTATRCASPISRRCSGRSSASRRASCSATTSQVVAADPAVRRRPAAGDEAVSERRRQAGVLPAAASGDRRRRACAAKCCRTTSSRSTKKARAIG